jgi:predicted RNase H-like HicB family nuclease
MNIHEQVLTTATRLAGADWRFTLGDVVHALPHLNVSSVRTHVVSRCCVNAPNNHLHKWAYFRRVSRGQYEIMPAYRIRPNNPHVRDDRMKPALKDTIHVVVSKSQNTYTAECVELAAITQGDSLDELFLNVQEAVALHLEDEDPADFGLQPNPRLQLIYDVQRAR